MKKNIFITYDFLLALSIPLLFYSCQHNYQKGKHYRTVSVCENIYIEVYTEFGSGALGGDIMCEYITDSINFRFRVGNFDNSNRYYSFNCFGDSLVISQSFRSDSESLFHPISTHSYSKTKLKSYKNINGDKISDLP